MEGDLARRSAGYHHQGIPVLLYGEHAWEHPQGASGTWSPNKNMRVILSGNALAHPESVSGTDYAVCDLDLQRGTFLLGGLCLMVRLRMFIFIALFILTVNRRSLKRHTTGEEEE